MHLLLWNVNINRSVWKAKRNHIHGIDAFTESLCSLAMIPCLFYSFSPYSTRYRAIWVTSRRKLLHSIPRSLNWSKRMLFASGKNTYIANWHLGLSYQLKSSLSGAIRGELFDSKSVFNPSTKIAKNVKSFILRINLSAELNMAGVYLVIISRYLYFHSINPDRGIY